MRSNVSQKGNATSDVDLGRLVISSKHLERGRELSISLHSLFSFHGGLGEIPLTLRKRRILFRFLLLL